MIFSGSGNDEKLLKRVRQGDLKAMRELYDRHVKYLSAVCSRYIINPEDVKDVLQESFLKIFSSIDSFEYRGAGSLRGWMSRIVLNDSLKFVRKNGRMEFVELSGAEMDKPEEVPDTSDIPSSVIFDMIRELPDGYRAIFNLYVVEGKSHKEIAGLLGIKESTSASQLHRAKAMLADKIKQYKRSI